MKKGQEYIGIVEKLEFGDRGIVRCLGEVGKVEQGKDENDCDEHDIVYVDKNDRNVSKPLMDKDLAIVKNCIVGQKIRFRVRKKRAGKAEGDLFEIIEKSPLETATPLCPHFGICGSCKYQTLPYEEQLLMKERQVREILNQAVKPFNYEYEWEGIVPSPNSYEYRNKMEFSFGNATKGGALTLGLHKKGSFYDICEVIDCRIVDEDFRTILIKTLELCRQYELSFYHKMTHIGYLRHLLVRKAFYTGEILVDLVTSSQAPLCEDDFLKKLSAGLTEAIPDRIVSVLHTINDSLSDTIQNDRTDILFGKDFIEEEILGLRFQISAFSFFQTNSKGAESLYEKAREFVLSGESDYYFENSIENPSKNSVDAPVNHSKQTQMEHSLHSLEKRNEMAKKSLSFTGSRDKTIFDLYSGTGTIAQLLAPVAKKVIGVEIVEEAVVAARVNAKKNGLKNCTFLAGDVLKVLDTIEERPDFIVLDPPRDGIHPKALRTIINYGVDRLLYISCKPTSLARDLVPLQEAGYRIEKAATVDLFAQTGHVETVVLMSKKA